MAFSRYVNDFGHSVVFLRVNVRHRVSQVQSLFIDFSCCWLMRPYIVKELAEYWVQ
jgi:hypothetical protein